eukprot:754688-Lingulodinium_polyedra.AAC.1
MLHGVRCAARGARRAMHVARHCGCDDMWCAVRVASSMSFGVRVMARALSGPLQDTRHMVRVVWHIMHGAWAWCTVYGVRCALREICCVTGYAPHLFYGMLLRQFRACALPYVLHDTWYGVRFMGIMYETYAACYAWCMVFGVWRLVFGVWRMARGVWRTAYGV